MSWSPEGSDCVLNCQGFRRKEDGLLYAFTASHNNNVRLLPDYEYDVSIDFNLPFNEANERTPTYPVHMIFFNVNDEQIFRWDNIGWTGKVGLLEFYLQKLRLSAPTQINRVDMAGNIKFDMEGEDLSPFKCIISVPEKDLVLYTSMLKIEAVLHGTKYFMYHWFWLTTPYVVIMMTVIAYILTKFFWRIVEKICGFFGFFRRIIDILTFKGNDSDDEGDENEDERVKAKEEAKKGKGKTGNKSNKIKESDASQAKKKKEATSSGSENDDEEITKGGSEEEVRKRKKSANENSRRSSKTPGDDDIQSKKGTKQRADSDKLKEDQGQLNTLVLTRRYSSHSCYLFKVCLLYTSDAADDLLCVDLGGRRIIKKKK
eukprot:TRINITY_DN10176_c0_g1_i12.p1 TRINITY_DN10176_c0_g1~~TRINITY_DN10176_c0_g1_i12.p1  ORF type:complete len:373 (+),score=98.78 TRINITY_DN10176_c0_g1_i12:228-1346(+)